MMQPFLPGLLAVYGRDQIGYQFFGVGGAEAGDGVPAFDGGIALDLTIVIVTGYHIVEVLSVGAGVAQFVEGRIDEAQGMTGHLVSDSHDAGPEWSCGAGATCDAPGAALVHGEASIGIGGGRDIGNATAVFELIL